MKVTLPADTKSAVIEVGAIAALLDKNGWRAAAYIAVSVKPGEGHGGRTATSGRLSTSAFAKALNARGWSKTVIQRHFAAWEKAADAGIVPHAADLFFGQKIEMPTEDWQTYYPPRWAGDESAEAVAAQAEMDGAGKSKAVDIAQNPKAMASAIKADPRVAAVAAQALVDTGDIDTLSRATASVAKNRQVERNRNRVSNGMGKGKSVTDPKPKDEVLGAEVSAFLHMVALPHALTDLVTVAPREWAALPNDARTADIIGLWDEMLDKIEIAVSNLRTMVGGGVSDADLISLLEGGV